MATNIAFVGGERQVNFRDPLDTDLSVINGIAGDQISQAITALPNGGFVVVYTSEYEALPDRDIMAVEFNAAGDVVAKMPMQLELDGGGQNQPNVTWRAGGGFAAVWTDSLGDSSSFISIGIVPAGSTVEPLDGPVDIQSA